MEPSTESLLRQLKVIADPARMRIVALCRHGECSVSELARVIDESQPRASQHLKQLIEAGLLQRFRDGQRVYYRVPARAGNAATRRQLLELIPLTDPVFAADLKRLQTGRGEGLKQVAQDDTQMAVVDRGIHRAINRAIIDLTVTASIGDLLDIGAGRGGILKLLASRANRAIGVDIDADSRKLARAELMLSGIPNCTVRKGNMYQLPFGDAEFDTVILDDVLGDAERPVDALAEAGRLLRATGRLVILQTAGVQSAKDLQKNIAGWCASAGLRLGPARMAPGTRPAWLLSVATPSSQETEAA